MESVRGAKTVKQSVVEIVHLVHPSDMNSSGKLYGGMLMQWIDDAAVLVAKRHSEMNVTTAAVENLKFLHGAGVRDTIVMIGKLIYVGRTSMEIRVDSYVEHMDSSRDLVNRAFLTLVALDENNRPAMVPELILETDEEKEEWQHSKIRHDMKKKQLEEGFDFYA